ncbi:FAD-binding protein [Hydrogenoanaerobacterium sp.]|uniref:FAD-binding protein n=1 Tax=Hydrogenoanaerobacterium sp. TaxID=2953763 RepID=UPI00289AA0AC|nr:FAD-binding protein [Hydrogenoanaerobacterium sp.]
MYDIAIIGLGPAGATLARLLDKRFKVVAIDKKRDQNLGFRKPCGGLLATDAQKALSRFDLTLPKDVLVDPQIFAVRTLDLRTGLTRHYQRFYINLDRHKFDLWLKSLIPHEVEIFDNAQVTRVARKSDCFEVCFAQDGKERQLKAKYVVGADGAQSLVRKMLYPNKKIRSYVSIQQWFRESNPNPFYSCVFDPENTDCYSWSISKDGSFIFGGAYPANNCRERFERQKQRLQEIGIQFGEVQKTEACLVLRPSKLDDFCCGYDNAFLIGEAAGFISPSSLEGISSAINTAYDLSKVLNAGTTNPCAAYRRKTLGLRIKLFCKVLKCPFMYFPPLRKLVMKSGLDSIHMA